MDYLLSPKITKYHYKKFLFASLLFISSQLSGCAIFRDAVDRRTGAENTPKELTLEESIEEEAPLSPRAVSTQFEWAVQYFESGQYEQAITSFRKLEKQGAKIAAFELIPFYLGMSFKALNLEHKAVPYLEKFIASAPETTNAQEARIALLLCYENMREWKKLSSTAAELEKFPLYMENKSLLQLLWAEALLEQNELQSAKRKVNDASSIINSLPLASPDNEAHEMNPSGENLFGRYIWMQARVSLQECEALRPQTQNKKQKKKNYFLDTWMETKTTCVKKVFEQSLEPYASLSPERAHALVKILMEAANSIDAIPAWLAKNQFFSTEKEAKNTNKQQLRIALYSILSSVENRVKNFQYQPLSSKYLEELFKHIEHLIYQLSLPSS